MDEKHLTLSELLNGVKGALSAAYPLGVWVTAEIGELNVNPYSGHCYLELIEKGDAEGAPRAKAQATVWRSRWSAIDAYFKSATGESLAAGMAVLVKVSVTFHEIYGFSLSVTDIDPAFTLGETEQRRRQTIARLKADGVIDCNSSLELTTVVQRIAVISSAQAAGLRDFLKHLDASPYRFDVELFDALMQGADAENSIIAALEEVALRADEFDTVVVIRGGGSRSDLACFDSYALCANIAQFPLPVLTGIGHDKDVSVADIVAFRALKTPTAVADFIVDRATEFEKLISDRYGRVVEHAADTIAANRTRIERYGLELSSAAVRAVHSADLTAERTASALRAATDRITANRRQTLDRCLTLLRLGVENVILRRRARLDEAAAMVDGNNPRRILQMGFAIVCSGGKAQSDAANLKSGDEVDITLAKGAVKAKIS